MGRRPQVPSELTKGPFSLEEARARGLTRSALRSTAWQHLGSELYCRNGVREDPRRLLSAWQRLLPPEAVFAGATAAWILGLDLVPNNPVEVVVPARSGVRSRDGLSVRHCRISRDETANIRGLPATKLHRTLLDICLRVPAVEALVAIDMAVRMGLSNAADLTCYADSMHGRPGARQLRLLAVLGAPAESPMETRLRWLVIRAGLPHPEVQTDLHDSTGRFVGRADLYYPAAGLVLEYDGRNHRERLVEDDRRQNLVINAGYRLLRFTAADVNQRTDVVVAQVRGALVTDHVKLRPPRSLSFGSSRSPAPA